MPCSNCSSNSPITFSSQYFVNNDCNDCEDSCGGVVTNSKCVFYSGPNLSCSGVSTGDSLEAALQKIDVKICTAVADYSNYTFNCLVDFLGSAITTEDQFVDGITAYACDINSRYITFTGTTFPNYQTTVNNRFAAIEVPGTVCATAGVINTDSLQTILSKYCTKLTSLSSVISISGVNWGQCLTSTTPTTIAGAFSLLVDQICQVRANSSGNTLPVFNNTGTCLDSPGTTDTLVSTIGKIKTRLCLSPTYNKGNVTWGCVGTPSGTATNIEDGIQTIVNSVNVMKQGFPSFDNGDFDIVQSDPGDPCSGVTISLATPALQDRFVAANASDGSPSTLINKLVGVGISVDDTTTPGKITLTSTATADSYKVKADITDSVPDYLDNKLNGGADGNGLTITTNYNGTTQQIDITPSLDMDELVGSIIDILEINPTLKARLCALIATCPSPCASPTNVQAVEITTTTTLAP